jgi:hypothetical protein
MDVLLCTMSCIRPTFSLSCAANCAAQGCADVQFFVDQAVMCIVRNIQHCDLFGGGGPGPDLLNCFMQYCSAEFAACVGATC